MAIKKEIKKAEPGYYTKSELSELVAISEQALKKQIDQANERVKGLVKNQDQPYQYEMKIFKDDNGREVKKYWWSGKEIAFSKNHQEKIQTQKDLNMGLSAEKKKSLKALYETWGLDKVRKDLERHQYPSLLSTEVSAFERAWLNAKEAKGRRRQQYAAAMKFIFFSLFAGFVAAIVAF